MSLYCEIQFEDEKRGYFYESENPLEVLNWVKEKVTRYEYKDYDVIFDRFFYEVNADDEDAKDRGCINFILRKKEEINKCEPERKKLFHMIVVVPALRWRTHDFYLNENNYELSKKDLPFD